VKERTTTIYETTTAATPPLTNATPKQQTHDLQVATTRKAPKGEWQKVWDRKLK